MDLSSTKGSATKDGDGIYNYYDALQYSLNEADYPGTEDRTHCPRTTPSEAGITIAVLSSPASCMPILLEGGRACPEGMLLVMSPTWLSLQQSDGLNAMKAMFVHKAVTFADGGKTFLDVFNPPRKVTYFMNFFTHDTSNGQDGFNLESNLECPTSGRVEVDDELQARLDMAEAGLVCVETIAFCYQMPHDEQKISGNDSMKVIVFEQKDGIENRIENEVKIFCSNIRGEKVAVKLSSDTKCVTYHEKHDTSDIIQSVTDLIFQIQAKDSVMVEEVLTPSNGIDYIVVKYIPIALKVNNYSCIEPCQKYKLKSPDLAGHSVRPLLQTMCERSQRYTMRDKVIAVIGHGGPFKEYILELARKDNIQVVLVANIPRDKVPCVATYLKYDFSDHIKDDKHAKHILQKLDNLGIELDGCCTFDEFCAPLAALLCEMLKLDGPGFKSTRTAKRKSSTQNCIINYKVDDVHFPSTYSYGERCYHIENKHDIKIAEKSLKFPAIMKLEHGAGAVGVKLVQNGEEAREHFEDLQSSLEGKFDKTGPLGELLGHGSSMLLMAYIDGTEHSVDIVLYKRKLIAVFVKDKVVTPYFTEALACMPSRLSSDQIEQITTAAFQCCTQVGLISGVFNLDMKMTSIGPKLIEINARMGGLYHRDWIKKVYGVDLVRCVFMTACGIKPVISEPKARIQMMGVMCFPSYHEEIFKNEHTRDLVRNLQADGSLHYKAIVESGQSADPDTEVPMCNIAVAADNLLEAKEKLLKICKQLQITRKDYIVEEFLQSFN